MKCFVNYVLKVIIKVRVIKVKHSCKFIINNCIINDLFSISFVNSKKKFKVRFD